MTTEIIIGITPVDEHEHTVVGRYRSHVDQDEHDKVEVIEISNSRLLHTRVPEGHPDGRLAVFSRFITQAELCERTDLYTLDPATYRNAILKGTTN